MKTVGFVTDSENPSLHPRDALLVPQLEQNGVKVQSVVWDASPSLEGCDGLVLRSCSNYMHAPDMFLSWLKGVESSGMPVWNPSALAAWNINKRYLLELEKSGIPIVPTVVVESVEDVVRNAKDRSWSDVVIKPLIGANGSGVQRISVHASARLLTQLHTPFLMQPYLSSVETEGEWSLIYIGGRFCHAVCKYPKGGMYANRSRGAAVESVTASASLLEIAGRTLAYCASDALYARVDMLLTDDEIPVVSEVELIETGLFTDMSPDVPCQFGRALTGRLRLQ